MTDTSSTTPRHSLPYLFAAQAQKELFVNEAFARIDAALHPAIMKELPAPPAAPADGESYLVATGAGAEWAGHDGQIATFVAGGWQFAAPAAGLSVWERSRDAWAVWNGSNWLRASAPVAPEGGSIIDTQARAAIAELQDKLRMLGVFST